ncbi:TonB-dependent receptor [Chitinophaga filiformis]|uniref:TonB-dependent receptor n=1 Tax=Chitinophaga filiformis TaxID=104663 RepID=UPI001F3403F5|nr:TonB-dependent receptor [Chitinophaga filiformis]MCF6404621.1 TonB-dependent receptor [Chitinophaga filiformis]
MKSHYLLTVLIILALSQKVFSQSRMLTGHVKDAEGNSLPFASVAIRSLHDTGKVRNAQADSAGTYQFRQLPAGTYVLTATFLNIFRNRADTVLLGGDKTIYNLVLHAAATNLSGIVVSSSRPPMTTEKGKIIFNVQHAANGAGQTALDLLGKIPGISVDGEGNISYGGSGGVNVMVNGRMTYFSGAQLANYLKGLNTEDLSKIELISSPDASFDAAGNAGIINIVSKKKISGGLAIDLRSAVSVGRYWMTNQNIALNYTAQQFSLYGGFDYNTPHKYLDRKGGNVLPQGDDTLHLRRSTASAYKIRYYTWRAGMEYRFHPQHTLGLHYHGYLDDFTCVHNTTIQTIHKSGALQSASVSRNSIVEPYYYDAVNLAYKYDIDSAGKKLTVDADYTSYRNYSEAAMVVRDFESDGSSSSENTLWSYQPGFVKIKSVKADVELPFNGLLLKAGLKYAAVSNDNAFRFDSLQNGTITEIDNISNHFQYNERIAAGYISATVRIHKTSINAGLRLENTGAGVQLLKQRTTNHWKFTQLFPSLSVEHSVNDDHQLNLSVSRRINRPGYTELNPVRWYRDPYFYYSGNPALVPDLAWNLSAVYNLQRKYIFTLSYRHSNRYVSEQLAFDEYTRAIKSQSANLGTMQRVEGRISIPLSICSFWQLQYYANVSYTTYPISMTTGRHQLSQWSAAFSLQQDFSLPGGVKATLNSYLTTAELRGIYRSRAVYYHDAGLKKTLWQNKCSVQITVSDLFDTSRLQGQALTDFTDFYYNDKPDSRRCGLSVTYHIGGRSAKPSFRKTEEQERL